MEGPKSTSGGLLSGAWSNWPVLGVQEGVFGVFWGHLEGILSYPRASRRFQSRQNEAFHLAYRFLINLEWILLGKIMEILIILRDKANLASIIRNLSFWRLREALGRRGPGKL